MAADQRQVEEVVAAIVDPEINLALRETGMVRAVRVRRKSAAVVLAVPIGIWPTRDALIALVRQAVLAVPGIDDVSVEVGVMEEDERALLRATLRRHMEAGGGANGVGGMGDDAGPGAAGNGEGGHGHEGHGHGDGEGTSQAFMRAGSLTRVIGVSSGKGGVGKSSVTVNLAVALAQAGHSVGILDADVYGFSVPKMIGAEHDPVVLGDLVVPTLIHGVRCLSMGFFVPDDQPVIWRGPLLHKAIEQFLSDAYWGEPEFILVDMPPGTGDVTLTLAQVLPRTEIVVVTTPQPAAQRVAQRSAYAARKLKLSVRGVIENMSWFVGDDGTRYELFGRDGGDLLARDLGVPMLGQVPLVPAVRIGGDEGNPIVVSDPESEAALAFRSLANRLAGLGPARVYRRELTLR